MNTLRVFILFLCSFSELWAYKNLTVENPHVCSDGTRRTLKLGSGTESAILITQRRLSDHRIAWNRDFKCSFDVKGRGYFSQLLSEPIGIFAVVQGMKLRRDPTTHECIDYIQFKDGNGRTSLRLCGELDAQHAMDSRFDDSDEEDSEESHDFYGLDHEVASLTYDDPYGDLTVYIFIDSKPLQRGETTDFLLAFTGYKHCKNAGFKTCENDRSKCIYEAFFNDGVVNCPYYDCVDEGGCKVLKLLEIDQPLSVSSHILIGSATSLVVSFIVFVLCLYTCRKYGKLCWSEEFSRPTPNIRPPPSHAQSNAQVSPSAAETVNLHTPAAPTAPSPEDKDMPPSYESLFPPGAAR